MKTTNLCVRAYMPNEVQYFLHAQSNMIYHQILKKTNTHTHLDTYICIWKSSSQKHKVIYDKYYHYSHKCCGSRQWVNCRPADLQTGQRVFCRPSLHTWSAKYPFSVSPLTHMWSSCHFFFWYLLPIEKFYVPNNIENAYWFRFMAFSIPFGT